MFLVEDEEVIHSPMERMSPPQFRNSRCRCSPTRNLSGCSPHAGVQLSRTGGMRLIRLFVDSGIRAELIGITVDGDPSPGGSAA